MSVWRDDPPDARFANLDAVGTVELCNSLADYGEAGGLSPELMLRVGRFAEGKYGNEPDVLVAAARMYFLGGELMRARTALLRAARMGGSDDARLRLVLSEVLRELGDETTVDQTLRSALAARTDSAIPPPAIADLPVASTHQAPEAGRGRRPEDIRTEVSMRARKLKEKNEPAELPAVPRDAGRRAAAPPTGSRAAAAPPTGARAAAAPPTASRAAAAPPTGARAATSPPTASRVPTATPTASRVATSSPTGARAPTSPSTSARAPTSPSTSSRVATSPPGAARAAEHRAREASADPAVRGARPPEPPRSLRIKLLDPDDERRRLDPYEIIGEIASGGMATVFLARRPGAGGFQRFVAIKRLYPHLAADEQFIEMFLDEARLAAGIHHPHVVSILEIEQDDGGYYLVMEFIEGDTLAGLTARSLANGTPIPRPVAVRIVLDALAGLHAAHEVTDSNGDYLGLVHRDCTPQNILVGIDGSSRITDFGVARAESRLTHTRPQMVKGKVAYLSPEQAYAQEVDRRSDLFTMGIVLWESLAGRALFQADSEAATLARLLSGPIPSVRNFVPDTPQALDEVCRRALQRDRNRRFRTAAELADALERAARDEADGVASPRDVGLFVENLIGPEIVAQREAVRAWLGQSASGDSGPMSRRAMSAGRTSSLPSIPAVVLSPSKSEPAAVTKASPSTPPPAPAESAKAADPKAKAGSAEAAKATEEKAATKDDAAKDKTPSTVKSPAQAGPPGRLAALWAKRKLSITVALAVVFFMGATAPIWIRKVPRVRAMIQRLRNPPGAQMKGGQRRRLAASAAASASGAPVSTDLPAATQLPAASVAPKPARSAEEEDLGPDILGQPAASAIEVLAVPDAGDGGAADAGPTQ